MVLAGITLILFHTRRGPGITGDSVHYVMGAENLLDGKGYARTSGGGEIIPITAFPPGYSWLLSIAGLLSGNLFEIGRWLSALLFGATIGLSSLLVLKHTSKATTAIFASALVLLSEDLLQIFSWVMSEPAFIVLMLIGAWTLARHIETGSRKPLIAAAVIFAFSTLVRYVGLSFLGAGVVAILILGRRRIRDRIINSFAFAAIYALPLAVWFYRNAALGGSITNRALGFHLISADLGFVFLGTANAWFFPLTLSLVREIRGLMSVAIVVTILGWFIYDGWEKRSHSRRDVHDGWEKRSPSRSDVDDRWALPWVLLIGIPIYLIALLFNTSFLDASTTRFGAARYLTPVLVSSIILVSIAGARLLERIRNKPAARGLLMFLGLFILSTYGVRAAQVLSDPGKAFRYTDIKNDEPQLVAALSEFAEEVTLISNDPELIYALVDRPAYRFPIAYDHYQQALRTDLAEQIQFTRDQLEAGAVVVIFDAPSIEEDMEIIHMLEAVPLFERDGAQFYSGADHD